MQALEDELQYLRGRQTTPVFDNINFQVAALNHKIETIGNKLESRKGTLTEINKYLEKENLLVKSSGKKLKKSQSKKTKIKISVPFSNSNNKANKSMIA